MAGRIRQGQEATNPTNKGQRTSIGANLFASPTFIASTLPARESHYFREFLAETDPDKRDKILGVVSPEMRRALSAQWSAQKARLAVAEGRDPGPVGEGGREYDDEALAEYEGADTKLDYANWLRSKEIADFFSRTRSFRPAQHKRTRARAGENRPDLGSFSVPHFVGQRCPVQGRSYIWFCIEEGRGYRSPAKSLDTYGVKAPHSTPAGGQIGA